MTALHTLPASHFSLEPAVSSSSILPSSSHDSHSSSTSHTNSSPNGSIPLPQPATSLRKRNVPTSQDADRNPSSKPTFSLPSDDSQSIISSETDYSNLSTPTDEKLPTLGSGDGLPEGSTRSRRGSRFAEATKGVRDRMKNPLLGSGTKLEELKEQFHKNVEVKFAPLNIPPHRRLQTAVVALWALMLPICLISFLTLMYAAWSFTALWVVIIPYVVWVQFDTAPSWGGRPKRWARGSFIWKYFADYYPASIVKEADLPADRPYLFGYHPHGIIGMGAFATFATEGTGFSTLFPGIYPHLLTLESNFKIPLYRDFILLHGMASVSKKACKNMLSLGAGHAIAIVIGGASESLSAHPGTADLTLKKRFGFVKIAIREGADLVPVFSFGENDIYDQLANDKGTFVYKLQKKFQQLFGFTLPLFYGRGIFNYNYGLMPFRHPIISVFGKPISIQQHDNPPDEMVQEIQKQYIDELMSIWDKYKDEYARHRRKELTLVG